MKIILLQDVPKIGKKFETKNVSDGFALNFLFPQKLAKLATAQVVKEIEVEKKKHEFQKETEVKEMKDILIKLKDPIEIKVKANKVGKLFAGLDKKEIGEIIQDKTGVILDPNILQLEKPIKEIGEYTINIKAGGEESKIVLVVKGESKK